MNMLSETQCWNAVLARDRSFDGRFFFGVVTTGVYCRPSCPSRHPLRTNVRFFQGPAEAEQAGLRPCKRCRPLFDPAQAIADLCRYIERHCEGAPRPSEPRGARRTQPLSSAANV